MTAPVTILGGGNTAFATGAKLALEGCRVTLCELHGWESMIEPIRASRVVELDGVAGRGLGKLELVTSDFGQALAANELVLLIVPSYAHRAFAEACANHLRAGQVVVLMPGNMGALEFARIVREARGPTDLVVAETDTAPYVCRKLTPTRAHIWGVVERMGLAAFPSRAHERVRALVEPLFPGIQPYAHVVACGLAAMNPVVHPAGVLLNAGRIERSRGEFYFYDEGVTPSVCRLIEAVDRERLAIARALGIDLLPVAEAFHQAGFGPRGDLWSTINGSHMLTQLRAPGSLETRWLSEDVPYGLATWAALGEQLGVPGPTIRAVIALTSAATGNDFLASARTPAQLGIAGLDRAALMAWLER